jgi:hypothetical protein
MEDDGVVANFPPDDPMINLLRSIQRVLVWVTSSALCAQALAMA